MKKTLIVLSVALLGQVTFAQAATDWTPHLKPMLSGCNFSNDPDKLPARYKTSIASKKVRVDSTDYGVDDYEGDTITTYHLKNATAFGHPLSKIEYLQGYEWGHLKLYFKDSKFTALRPQFKLPKDNKQHGEYITVTKNNASGYEVEDIGYVTLAFNSKEKSIVCDRGL